MPCTSQLIPLYNIAIDLQWTSKTYLVLIQLILDSSFRNNSICQYHQTHLLRGLPSPRVTQRSQVRNFNQLLRNQGHRSTQRKQYLEALWFVAVQELKSPSPLFCVPTPHHCTRYQASPRLQSICRISHCTPRTQKLGNDYHHVLLWCHQPRSINTGGDIRVLTTLTLLLRDNLIWP